MNKLGLIIVLLSVILIGPLVKASEAQLTWKDLKELDGDGQLPTKLQKKFKDSVSMRGFMMPLDYSAKKISEFLLMPYIPTCMHVPTPASNQIVLIRMKKGQEVEPSFYPIEVKGRIKVEESKDFESSYSMIGSSILELDEKQQSEVETNMPTHSAP